MNHKIAAGKFSARILILLSLLCCASLSFAAVNYDTTWTFVYDGAPRKGKPSIDRFYDIKELPDGKTVCVGISSDTSYSGQSILFKFDTAGHVVFKKIYNTKSSNMSFNRQSAHSVAIAKNGDYIVAGERYLCLWIMRLDTLGNIKWSTWYYDSIKDQSILSGSGIVNCVRETKRGTIICAVGDEYPNNGGNALSNYAAFLEFTGDGVYRKGAQWDNPSGYKIGGFYVDEGSNGYYLLSGNQAVYYLDTNRAVVWRKNYTFSLPSVGTETNNVNRVKMLRDGSLMVAGQAYEGNCWRNWQKFYYDAWHSPISYVYGTNSSWDTAGVQGADDIIYDFTQLTNGNLVFVGTRGDRNGPAPLWVFVTDSTGKQLLMDKKFCLPRQDGNGTCGNTFPLSVAATNDTGFTIVGQGTFDTISGWNGFAAHFVPSPVSSVSRISHEFPKTSGVRVAVSRSRVAFSMPEHFATENVVIDVFDGRGKRVGEISGCSLDNSIIWNCGRAGAGVYVYSMKNGRAEYHGTFAVQR